MLEVGKMYHLYNRGNNRENLFYKKENYYYFIRQFDKYLSDFVDVYAYCLLPNHFHFLIKVKEEEEILRNSRDAIALSDRISTQSDRIDHSKIISEQFRRFFISYSQAINKQEKRVGSLFQKNFKTKEVDSEDYFTQLIVYIHANPQKHGITKDFRTWEFSSYKSVLIEKNSKLKKSEVVGWFGNTDLYKNAHNTHSDFKRLEALELEG